MPIAIVLVEFCSSSTLLQMLLYLQSAPDRNKLQVVMIEKQVQCHIMERRNQLFGVSKIIIYF